MDEMEQRFVRDNMGIAQKIAWESYNSSRSIDIDELVSLAYEGLVDAAGRWRAFAESQDYQPHEIRDSSVFMNYARKRIKGQIFDYRRKVDHVPRYHRDLYNLFISLGYTTKEGVTYADLAEGAGIPIANVREVIHAVERIPVSFDAIFERVHEEAEEISAGSRTDHPGEVDVERTSLIVTVQDEVVSVLESMPPLEQIIFALRFYSGLELKQIAEELNAPLSHVRATYHEVIITVHSTVVARMREHQV